MDKELRYKEIQEIQELLTNYINKYNVREIRVFIDKYYDKKKAVIEER